jgi:hypothetical protein
MVKIYRDGIFMEAAPTADRLICTAVDLDWARRIADLLIRSGTGVFIVLEDGTELRGDDI